VGGPIPVDSACLERKIEAMTPEWGHISAMERGITLLNTLTLLRLAVALDCKVGKLVSVFDETHLSSILPVWR